MRELTLAALLLSGLLLAAVGPQLASDPAPVRVVPFAASAASPTPAGPPSWKARAAGAPFVVCGSSDTWRRPTIDEQNARLAADPRYRHIRSDDSFSEGWSPFRAAAVAYDGAGNSSGSGLAMLTGLWSDPSLLANRCTSAEPQIWLLGYEPVSYRLVYQEIAELVVRERPGYRIVVLTGVIPPQVVVVSTVKLAYLEMPADAITPTPTPRPKPTPIPTPQATTMARVPLVPVFPRSDRPLGLSLPSSCVIESSGRHEDDLGATWRIQCGSAKANRDVADAAIAQGWRLFDGNPPIGQGLQNYTRDGFWMQIAYRLDGPALADAFVIVQSQRPGVGTGDSWPHGFSINGCGIVDPPTRSPDGAALKWLARCGDVGKAIEGNEELNARDGWRLAGVATDAYATRRYCKGTFETLWRSGADLGPGVVAITQTDGGCR